MTSTWLTRLGSNRRNVIEPIEIDTHTKQSRSSIDLGGPEYRSNINTNIRSHIEIESIELRPTLLTNNRSRTGARGGLLTNLFPLSSRAPAFRHFKVTGSDPSSVAQLSPSAPFESSKIPGGAANPPEPTAGHSPRAEPNNYPKTACDKYSIPSLNN